MENKLEYRMYFLSIYQLMGIQKGIQSLYSCIEYSLKYGKDKDYQKWATIDKTVIILNGGNTTTLKEHHKALIDNKIKVANFYEPDLDNAITSVAFLVSEQVFDKIKYPDYINHELEYKMKQGIIGLSAGDNDDFEYNVWLKGIGGEQNAFLRTFLKNFKLA